jgi:hypothetical protein
MNQFEKVKATIKTTYALQILDFSIELLLYTFTNDHSLAAVLTQKDDQGDEFPISFMSTSLQGA